MNYLIANWKQNKTVSDYEKWIKTFFADDLVIAEGLVPIISPNYLQLPLLNSFLKENDREDVFLASQDISQYKAGKHTGLIGADQVVDFATFTIIGHSEKRADGDTVEIVNKKIERAIEYGITPIICFSKISQYNIVVDTFDVKDFLFAYEPLDAIGSGKPEDPATVEEVGNIVKKGNFLYGGSVDVDNIDNYLKISTVKGFLVGTASLDPQRFKSLINKYH